MDLVGCGDAGDGEPGRRPITQRKVGVEELLVTPAGCMWREHLAGVHRWSSWSYRTRFHLSHAPFLFALSLSLFRVLLKLVHLALCNATSEESGMEYCFSMSSVLTAQ